MRTNTGEIDRIIRILIGITLIMAGIIFISGIVGYVIVFFGLVMLITGIVGICPLYNLLGFSSKGQGIDKISKKDIEDAVKNHKSSEIEEDITKIKPEKTSNISKEKNNKSQSKKKTNTSSAEKNKKMKATVQEKKVERKKVEEPKEEKIKEEKPEIRIYPSRLPNFNLETVKGIGKRNANRLRKMKIDNTAKFLAKASSKKGREEISKETGIETSAILTWANHIDLFRVKGIRENYANLLHEADVNTIPELANRNSQNLFETLTKANNEKKLVKSMPNEKEVKMWVNNAKRLKRVISY